MWDELARHVDARYGRPDVLHSNAYAVVVKPPHELTEAEWDGQVSVTLKAAWLGVRAFAQTLRDSNGSVVLTSSVHAPIGLPGHPAYAAAKGALCALGRQLAVEYGPQVRVNTIVPGPIMTAAWDRVDQVGRADSVAETVAKRFGTPEEAAATSRSSHLPTLRTSPRASGNTSARAFQKPSAPSPTARTGARIPRRWQSRSKSPQESADSR